MSDGDVGEYRGIGASVGRALSAIGAIGGVGALAASHLGVISFSAIHLVFAQQAEGHATADAAVFHFTLILGGLFVALVSAGMLTFGLWLVRRYSTTTNLDRESVRSKWVELGGTVFFFGPSVVGVTGVAVFGGDAFGPSLAVAAGVFCTGLGLVAWATWPAIR
ncbi:hypothetical protein [Haloferax sp. DFSO52]|uniref:hypothetical protein n=1 Tax=Haloferax sp. DFSO52 TaxID=3388505 RepID=UPI003A85FB80